MMKLSCAAFLVFALVLITSSVFYPAMAYPASGRTCGDKCKTRCSKAGVLDRCIKYCGICCQQCKCVPSGTYGNKHECPCYRDMRNSKGKPKCP
ncbi:Gibberellin regulated protein [Parasponia andersonii]|uniref:Gibberellin regulated protein n=1 Tax=Parasponia andersonii TaxID=3476 RepID=A0A2P5DN83_PARAD|nr:Gibberellin regulated protein [Parasponia andersonii]